MVSFLKKTRWIVSKIGMRSWFDTASTLLLITFSSYLFEDHFSIFPLFQSAEKSVFSTFLKMGSFLSVSLYNNSEQFQKDGFDFNLVLNNSFLLFEKNWFFPFLTQRFDGKKILKILKWFKMDFDGWFELTIVNLVGIEYLKVKNG